MSDFYLRFFQEVENYDGQLWDSCIVLVEHSIVAQLIERKLYLEHKNN